MPGFCPGSSLCLRCIALISTWLLPSFLQISVWIFPREAFHGYHVCSTFLSQSPSSALIFFLVFIAACYYVLYVCLLSARLFLPHAVGSTSAESCLFCPPHVSCTHAHRSVLNTCTEERELLKSFKKGNDGAPGWLCGLAEHQTLDFSCGRDLRVVGSSPCLAPCSAQRLLAPLLYSSPHSHSLFK